MREIVEIREIDEVSEERERILREEIEKILKEATEIANKAWGLTKPDSIED